MNFHYPRYHELPEGLVFIDEVVDLVNDVHACLPSGAKNGKEKFTRSMASNYMKQGLTPPAVGKKYTRDHVCLVLFAATIKLVNNAEGTIALSRQMFSSGDFESTQNMIAEIFEESMASMSQLAASDAVTGNASAESGAEQGALASLLANAVAAKVFAYRLTSEQ